MLSEIVLAPCKDSLYDIINKNGLTFYKSPVSVEKLNLFLDDFNRKKDEVISFMNENNITEEFEYEHIILWNNTQDMKDHIIQSFENKKKKKHEEHLEEIDTVSVSYDYDYDYESDEYEFNDYTYNNYVNEYKEETYEDDFYDEEIEDTKVDDDYY